MADLIAISFPTPERAREVRAELLSLQREHLVDLEDAAVVTHHSNGKIKLDQSIDLAAQGALGGAFWGTVVGLLLLNPLLGLGVGMATGALMGAVADVGIDDRFMKELAESLPRGSSALFVLVRRATYDRLFEALAPFNGRIVRTSLSHEQEQRLIELVAEHSVLHSAPEPRPAPSHQPAPSA